MDLTLLLAATLTIGAFLTAQAAANVQLSRTVGNPVAAAALQLGVAAVLLVVVAIVGGQLDSLGASADVDAWHLLGGLGSAIYIAAGIVLFPRLGAVLSVGLFITGQMVASVLLDGFGWLGLEQQPPSVVVLLGAVAVIYGIATIVRTSTRAAARQRRAWPLMAFGIVAGATLPTQAAVNAQLRVDLDAPFGAAAVSFAVAVMAMLVVLAISPLAGTYVRPSLRTLPMMPWWGWLGGLIGAAYVTITLIAVPEIGAAPAIALTIAGQQLASAAADHYGLLRLPRRPVTQARLAGVATLLAGAVLTQLG